jgi:hypothetical protein
MIYATVNLEGGFFPADLLDRIAAGDADLPGLRAGDFGLDSRRLTDELQDAYSYAQTEWNAFQRRVQRAKETGQSLTTVTREGWINPLLERLDYVRRGYVLVRQPAAVEAGNERFLISHRAGEDSTAPPVHIVGFDDELDRRGEHRRSPHASVQEYLNRSDSLWGIVTNGRTIRLLRRNERLAKSAYLEFDIAGMMESNVYSEFALLYLVLHRTRLPKTGGDAPDCILEQWYQRGIDEGGRVRERLRDGVEAALKRLGNALLKHERSDALREEIASGRLSPAAYYRELLRLIYRLLFLMVAEERRLMFPETRENEARRAIFSEHYGIGRLRDRADRYVAEDAEIDLWERLKHSFVILRDDRIARMLGIAALNGELFGSRVCEHIESACCRNDELLRAIHSLSTFVDGGVRRRVNYSGLDVEELGSVYESLLDYHPEVSAAPPHFDLVVGSERRATGSYYTPPELVKELIEHALVPVMEERLAGANTKAERETALLSLKVLDPACGSGHFLLAAGRRIGKELARIRTGEEEPSVSDQRHAVRDVIRQCIYAVDKNPLAVDLCKVALWIEGLNAGRPLNFLDPHVKCGDSLVGVCDLDDLKRGIPDEAYKAVTGDDKDAAREFRKRNKFERESGQMPLGLSSKPPAELAQEFAALAAIDERRPEDVAEKEARYGSLRAGVEWLQRKNACDAWTAAFFVPVQGSAFSGQEVVPTTADVWKIAAGHQVHGKLVQAITKAATDAGHPFFHWPLEFPDVFVAGGFDVLLGNPPFLGGNRTSGALGDSYFNYLTTEYAPAGGLADLCTYFYRRAFLLLRDGARLDMVATNTIGQGDTRQGGLAVIVRNNGHICLVRRFVKWPGAANVEVNLIGIRKGVPPKKIVLDGTPVSFISSRLDEDPEYEQRRLQGNVGKEFQGSIIQGVGFLVDGAEHDSLISTTQRNGDCLFPFLTGEDLNSRVEQRPSRWAINFFDWPLSNAEEYPALLEIVRQRVKPERDKVKRERNRLRWWIYAENRPGLYRAIRGLNRVLVRSRVSELHMLAFVPNGFVYGDSIVVFAFDDDYHFAILQSNIHEAWVWKHASSLESRNRYTPTDCFETFAFPQNPSKEDRDRAASIGGEYHEHRRQTMLARQLGLTKTYNLFHNPECKDADIARLRELHAEMDRAILSCYGWSDIDAGHGFHQNERGQTRFTVSRDARREILRRLLDLNLEIAAKEAGVGTAASANRRRKAKGEVRDAV